MPLFGRHKALKPTPEVGSGTLVASSPRRAMTAATWQLTSEDQKKWGLFPFGNTEGWATELWRLYDLIGEFRFAANWVGSACSRVRIYVAEVDENGRVQQETTNEEIAAYADVIFGGPTQKAEAVRSIGIDLTVAGECYILGLDGGTEPDEWHVVSGQELRRHMGGYNWAPSLLPEREITPGRDLIIRLWTPHPRNSWYADSPGRGAMAVLLELERLTNYVFAQIDSRLANAGVLVIPNDMDFPDDGTSTSAAEAWMNRWVQAASAAIQGQGTAAGVVPSVMDVPPEALGKIQFLEMTSQLSAQAQSLRAEAIRRLALAMDMPPEVLLGAGDTNHWQMWFVQESGIRVHVEPIMTRICEGLTKSYLRRVLLASGEDPDRYTFWFDTAPLTVRPERLQDAINLYNLKLISADAVRLAGDAAISDAPSEKEFVARNLWELVLRDTSLFYEAGIREALGVDVEITAPAPAVGQGNPPIPARTGTDERTTTPIPERSIAEGAPQDRQVDGPAPESLALIAGSHLLVQRALERAGGKLLTREFRGRFQQVPRMDLHTRVKVTDNDHASTLLDGAWDNVAELAKIVGDDVDLDKLRSTLDIYTRQLLLASHPHEPNNLVASLERAHLIDRGL